MVRYSSKEKKLITGFGIGFLATGALTVISGGIYEAVIRNSNEAFLIYGDKRETFLEVDVIDANKYNNNSITFTKDGKTYIIYDSGIYSATGDVKRFIIYKGVEYDLETTNINNKNYDIESRNSDNSQNYGWIKNDGVSDISFFLFSIGTFIAIPGIVMLPLGLSAKTI